MWVYLHTCPPAPGSWEPLAGPTPAAHTGLTMAGHSKSHKHITYTYISPALVYYK